MVRIGTIDGYSRDMSHSTRQQVTTVITAIVLFLQSVIAVPVACACGVDSATASKSCCDVEVASACCEQTDSCCQSGDCLFAEASSRCDCGCGDHTEHSPLAPAEKPERTQGDVEISLAISHLVTHMMSQSPTLCDAFTSVPHACSRPHAMQALLCVWRT